LFLYPIEITLTDNSSLYTKVLEHYMALSRTVLLWATVNSPVILYKMGNLS